MVDNFSASGVPELMFGRGVFETLGQHTIGLWGALVTGWGSVSATSSRIV